MKARLSNNLILIVSILLVSFNISVWAIEIPQLQIPYYRQMFIFLVVLGLGIGIGGFFYARLNGVSFLKGIRSWNVIFFIGCLLYSIFNWLIAEERLPPGVIDIENGKYVARNHGDVIFIPSEKEYYKMKKLQDLQIIGGISVFMGLGFLLLNRKADS